MSRFALAVLVAMLALGTTRLVVAWQAEDAGPEPAWFVRAIQQKAASAQRFAVDASIELAGKKGEDAPEIILKQKIKAASAPGGRFLFWAGDKANLEYLIVSDGSKTWAYMPPINKYVEIEAVAVEKALDPVTIYEGGVTKQDNDPVICARLIFPILARLGGDSAALVEMRKFTDSSEDREEDRQLPILSVLSAKDDRGAQNITELVLDPQTTAVSSFEWRQAVPDGEEPRFALMKVEFEKLQVGEEISPSYFTFDPGNAEKVEELPVPALFPVSLLKQPAPDYEFETASHKNVRLSSLRGKTVLLAFSSSDCAPCRKQATALATLQQQYKESELVVLEAGADRVQLFGRYRVQFVPTLVVIDREGKVVRFLPGFRDAAALRTALTAAGL